MKRRAEVLISLHGVSSTNYIFYVDGTYTTSYNMSGESYWCVQDGVLKYRHHNSDLWRDWVIGHLTGGTSSDVSIDMSEKVIKAHLDWQFEQELL